MLNNEKLKDIEKRLEERSANDSNPLLAFDAFMGGVKEGGLRSVSAISLMVCYLVSNLNGKVTAEVIAQALAEGEIANHFEVTNAISKLKSTGALIENGDGTLTLNKDSSADIELIEKDLPYTLRERSMHLCQKIIAIETHKRENKVEIEESGDAYNVVLHISDENTDFMTLSLFAASRDQAEMIKDKFIADPARVYKTLIETLFSNES